MSRGRPIAGLSLVDHVDAPRAARRRVRVVLATVAGQLSIAEACAQLGVQRTRFHALRHQVLRGALEAVGARPRGRPRAPRGDAAEVRALQARIRELELALRTTLLRSEIALTMPFLLDRAGRKKKARRVSGHRHRLRAALAALDARRGRRDDRHRARRSLERRIQAGRGGLSALGAARGPVDDPGGVGPWALVSDGPAVGRDRVARPSAVAGPTEPPDPCGGPTDDARGHRPPRDPRRHLDVAAVVSRGESATADGVAATVSPRAASWPAAGPVDAGRARLGDGCERAAAAD